MERINKRRGERRNSACPT